MLVVLCTVSSTLCTVSSTLCTVSSTLVIQCLYCSGFEVNFMDDVGQTLLNWAAAFGTQEMVSDSSV